jgi:hypothetical protein
MSHNNTTINQNIEVATKGDSLWNKAWYKFKRDNMGKTGAIIVFIYLIVALGVWFGIWGGDWSDTSDDLWQGPSWQHLFDNKANFKGNFSAINGSG